MVTQSANVSVRGSEFVVPGSGSWFVVPVRSSRHEKHTKPIGLKPSVTNGTLETPNLNAEP
jgi:hypothetical protein